MEKKAFSAVIGVIPARFNSGRFPGKSLALIAGKSLIQHTYENARQAQAFHELIVATDDQRIFDHVTSFGAKAVMTSPSCPTGTDRVIEVIHSHSHYSSYDIVVNLQGNEPCIQPQLFNLLCQRLQNDSEAVMATAMTPITSKAEAESRSVVKCVCDVQGRALYFSRSLIPCGHQGYAKDISYHRHIGVYAFRRDFLSIYQKLPTAPLQKAEDLEQLKILEHGYKISVVSVDEPGVGVDTPQDISKIEALLCRQNSSSLQAASVLA